MTIASRCHQHPVRNFPAVIEDGVSREVAHPTTRFLHDQIGRRKVPIMAAVIGTIKRRIIKIVSPAGAYGVRRLPKLKRNQRVRVFTIPAGA